MENIGRLLLIAGLILVSAGFLIIILPRITGFELGRLPRDLNWDKGRWRIYAPIGSMILFSVILTILLNIILRIFK